MIYIYNLRFRKGPLEYRRCIVQERKSDTQNQVIVFVLG